MTRNAVILAVICAFAGALYYVVFGDSLWISSSAMRARSANADEMYTLYRARRDIPEGTLVWQNDFEPLQVNQSQIPQDAISKIALVDGRQAKFGLSRRQIVSSHDLDPDPFRAVVVRAKTVIPKGVVIDATMVEEVKRSEQVPYAHFRPCLLLESGLRQLCRKVSILVGMSLCDGAINKRIADQIWTFSLNFLCSCDLSP